MLEIRLKYKKAFQIILLSIFCFIILTTTYSLRSIFNPVLLSLLLAYILNPIACFFERLKISRTITIFNIYLILTSSIFLLILFLIPLIGSEVSYLYQNMFIGDRYIDKNNNGEWDAFVDSNQNNKWDEGEGDLLISDLNSNKKYNPPYLYIVRNWVMDLIEKWNEKNPTQRIEWQFLVEHLNDKKAIEELGKTVLTLSRGAFSATLQTLLGIFSILSYVILLPLYTFFLLTGLKGIQKNIYDFLPSGQKEEIIRILLRIHHSVSAFFRGKLIICIVKGILTWGLLEMAGLRYPLLFGMIQAVASIVPFLVLLVGTGPNLIFLILDRGVAWPYIALVIAIYLLIEAIESFILTPWIMGKETGVHPLTVILSLMVGGELFGLFGLILAIPICTTLKIIGEELVLPAWHELSGCQAGNTQKMPSE